MSRGPGSFQRKLLAELQAARGPLQRAELRRRFPRQAEDHSLHRALRSLVRRKYVEEIELFGQPWIALCDRGHWIEPVREQLTRANADLRMLRKLAAARGVRPPELDRLAARLDTYKRATNYENK